MVDAVDLMVRALLVVLCSIGLCYAIADLSGPKMLFAKARAQLGVPGCAYCLSFWICPVMAIPLCCSPTEFFILSAAGIGGVTSILLIADYSP